MFPGKGRQIDSVYANRRILPLFADSISNLLLIV
jgi:hypothetical protein